VLTSGERRSQHPRPPFPLAPSGRAVDPRGASPYGSDLLATLEALVQRKSKFDYVIIETSGLAHPGNGATIPNVPCV
jgi:hypothetical protein